MRGKKKKRNNSIQGFRRKLFLCCQILERTTTEAPCTGNHEKKGTELLKFYLFIFVKKYRFVDNDCITSDFIFLFVAIRYSPAVLLTYVQENEYICRSHFLIWNDMK